LDFELFINIGLTQGMDIKTYVNPKKPISTCFLRIGIGFGFTIVYQHCKGIRHGYENLCQFQKNYVNIDFLGIDVGWV
jgi:hypothetical protein